MSGSCSWVWGIEFFFCESKKYRNAPDKNATPFQEWRFLKVFFYLSDQASAKDG